MGWKELSSAEHAILEEQFLGLSEVQEDKRGIMGPLHTYISDTMGDWGRQVPKYHQKNSLEIMLELYDRGDRLTHKKLANAYPAY